MQVCCIDIHSLPANPRQVCCCAQVAGEAAANCQQQLASELTDIKHKLAQVSVEVTAFAGCCNCTSCDARQYLT